MTHPHTEYQPDCGACVQDAANEGFRAGEEQDSAVCPRCGNVVEGQLPEVRVLEAEPELEPEPEPDQTAIRAGTWVSWKASSGTGCGRVSSIHTASTVPGVSRKVIGSADAPAARIKVYEKAQVGEGWVPTGRYTALSVGELTETDELTASPLAAEAINGQMSANDRRALLCDAIEERMKTQAGISYAYVNIVDHTDDAVVYTSSGDDLFQASYTLSGMSVELGDPVKVIRTVVYQPVAESAPPEPLDDPAPGPSEPDPNPQAATEADDAAEERDRLHGRVVESKGTDETGGRVYRTRLIAYGESKNARRYPEAVMREASALYEGAKAYDHHRTVEELASSTINGLVGSFRNVAAEPDGLYADLHLLPGATHAAETLDASLAAQAEGLPSLVGLSHDVLGRFRPVVEGGRRLQEATQITKVHSVDLVESPAAGGRAERAVAGGEPPTDTGIVPAAHEEEDAVPPTVDDILGALKEASPEQLAAILARAAESKPENPSPEEGTAQPAAEAGKPAAVPVVEAKTDGHPKNSFLGGLLIKSKVTDAGLPESVVEAVTAALPDLVSESAVDAQIAAIKHGLGLVERAGLVPKSAPGEGVQAGQEAIDKKRAALDAFFEGKYSEGYRSFRQAFVDFTGRAPRSFDEDFNRVMLRESFSSGFDSALHTTESLDSTSWGEVLGDSITRRLVREYQVPALQTWRRIVSSITPVTDFRVQRIGRVGGYGTLPVVGEGQPYQPLTSPTDEESTYRVIKRGGTEDLTLEMIANDDIRAIRNIPSALGRAAAHTLFRFVFDMLTTNATCTYDSTALFHANHANTDNPAVLAQGSLSVGRRRMRKQAAFGNTLEILSIIPRLLLVPSELEEIAFQLCRSAVAIPATPAGPSDTPNIHSSLEFEVVDYWTDPNDWYLVADTGQVPTIEVGFYQGREAPEVFTQADPSNGSVFNTDTLTYKIRHIYSGTILDHRGFYRGANT